VSHRIRPIAFVVLCLAVASHPARADLTLTLDDVTVAPNNTATMGLYLTSQSGYQLSSFGLKLQIIPTNSTNGLLQFTTTQSDPTGDANYVFFNNSSVGDSSGLLPYWSAPSTTAYSNDTIKAGDINDSDAGYSVVGSSKGSPGTYLGSVQFLLPAGANPTDQFVVTLVDDPSYNFTYFTDSSGNSISASSITIVGGNVTQPSFVPEPSSLTMVLAGLAGLVGWTHRRHGRLSRTILGIGRQ
jgi:hypothetical protein